VITGELFNLRGGLADGRYSLATLNSLTKYPSIPTYHPVGDRGVLQDVPPVRFHGTVDLTEKIDGANARVISLPDGTVIVGSREELLHARGDLIHNTKLGIVDTLRDLDVIELAADLTGDSILVVFGEVYGHSIGPGKRYSGGTTRTGFRVFDVAYVPVDHLTWEVEHAASWRQHGGQKWFSEVAIDSVARDLGVERVPGLGSVAVEKLPRDVSETHTWLGAQVSASRAVLRVRSGDRVAAEGVVIRGFDADGGRLLAKARFEDYVRTERAWARDGHGAATGTAHPAQADAPIGTS
jgi:hypothetical protein